MITAGMDFSWQFAEVQYNFFDNITDVFKNHSQGSKFRFQYSSVDEYFKAIFKKQQELKFEWPTYTSDFFPYNGYHMAHYWTGFYTSRPSFKKLIRDFTAQTQALDTYYTLELFSKMIKGNKVEFDSYNISHSTIIKSTNEWVATATHHDTITGTSPSYVIQNETSTALDKAMTNARIFGSSLREKAIQEEGFIIEALEACVKRAH